jgi:pimeloyl-ACP methyl ester carboxylesterase
MRTGCRLLLVLAALGRCSAAGAQSLHSEPPAPPGVVIVVGGVGGWDPLPGCTQFVCPLAGVDHQVYDFVWGHGWGQFFRDLMDTPHLVRKADELAELILQCKEHAPERPIYVVAKSGGSGLALLAAERLPPCTLERMILISAAVSPDYDLRPALRATRREVVSFCSNLDRVILGWGTSTFGTVDRCYGPGAGKVGFRLPPDLDAEDEALYRRLVEIHWRPSMLLQGYAGMHSGNSLPLFLLVRVVPWLR